MVKAQWYQHLINSIDTWLLVLIQFFWPNIVPIVRAINSNLTQCDLLKLQFLHLYKGDSSTCLQVTVKMRVGFGT